MEDGSGSIVSSKKIFCRAHAFDVSSFYIQDSAVGLRPRFDFVTILGFRV